MKDETVCCHGECLQGRACPYRAAVTPKHLLPGPKPDYLVEVTVAIATVIIVGAWALIWLLEVRP